MHRYRSGWVAGTLSLFLLLFLFPGTGLFAQTFQATLSGRVADASGAAISGARIDVTNVETGVVSSTVSDSTGNYQVGFLNAGKYSVTVEKSTFKTQVRKGITLQVAQHVTLNFQLVPGSVSQSVTVTGEPPQLQTQTADHGVTLDELTMQTMPTQGHNPIAGAFSAPGFVPTTHIQRLRPFDNSGSTGISINGSMPGTNQVLVDGVTSLYNNSTVSFIPTTEAVKEVRVQTTNFDAQFGNTLGGVINMITKSGTNQFHGAAWEFLQNTIFNANTFEGNLAGKPRSSSHINTFGFDVGGPIIRNKLFFFYNFDDLRQVIPDPFVTSVPTAAQKAGDFSQTFYAPGQLQVIYNPFSTTTVNGQLVRTPFPDNKIPQSLINPAAAKVLSFIPEGNTPGNPVTGLNNLTNDSNSRKFTDYFPENTIRIDYSINPTTRLFVRYSHNALSEERKFIYSTNSTVNPADPSQNNPFARINDNATLQLTKVLNPTTVLNIRLGFERFLTEDGAAQAKGHGPSTLGFSSTFAGQASDWFPTFGWKGYGGAGPANGPSFFSTISQTNTIMASLSKMLGRQSLEFGVGLHLLRANQPIPGFTAGSFSFDPEFTGADPLQIQPSSGNSIASFLLGTPASGFIDRNSEPARQVKTASAYVEDKMQLNDRLNVSLGLRWDYLGPMTDRFNGLTRGFARTAASPFQVPGQTLYGGLLFAGVDGNPRGISNQSWGNFGPRVGFAYRLDDNTVLRGGFGLIYGPGWYDPGEAPGFSQRTFMVTSIEAGVPFNTLSNPFPDGILQPDGASKGLETDMGESFSFADPNAKAPYVKQFAFGIQRQLPRNFLVTASYVGSRSSRLPVNQQINSFPASAIGLGKAGLTASVANPFAGLLPGTALNGATVQRQQLLAPYPQFLVGSITGGSGITERFEPIGTSSYDSGQFVVLKRLSNGLDFSVAYTISKELDRNMFANAQDSQLEKVIAAWDVPQNLQIRLLWQLPFGSKRAIGPNLPSPLRWAISNWTMTSLTRLQKGMPLDLTGSPDSEPIADPALSNPHLSQWFNPCTRLANGSTEHCSGGEQPAWTVRAPFSLQTWKSRLSSVRYPGIHNSDISLTKSNHITERVNLQFRTDFINAFNSPQWFKGPISDVNSSNFGVISGARSQDNLPRFIEFSMKAIF